jgi:hypothetical protein
MSIPSLRRIVAAAAVTLALSATASMLAAGSSPKFFDDDPHWVEPDTQDASGMKPLDVDLFVELGRNLLAGTPSHRNLRAANLNTVDEVPDSSWFTNRVGFRPVTPEEVATGPDTGSGPGPGPWTIVASKSDGVTPGFTVVDGAGEHWFLKFDPPGYRGMATGTEVTVTKLMWALGYHVPENRIAFVRREQLVVGAGAALSTADGGARPLRRSDIDALLERVSREQDGSYRVVASRRLPGTPVGRIQFSGTRSDDPNDLVPHEDRRELRGYGVFAAWLNHVDAKGINSLDMLIDDGGRSFVRHYLVDFGSALGSGAVAPADHWAGSEYLLEPAQVGRQIIGFGFVFPKWHTAPFYEARSIGRLPLHNAGFDPERWKPRVPNPAFIQARADDKFWAASKLAAMTTDLIRAAVRAGQFDDPRSEEFLVRALAERRDAILRTYLTAVNPIADPALDAEGRVSFRNAAVDADVARVPGGYRAEWFRFDNGTSIAERLGSSAARATIVPAAVPLPDREGTFVKVELSATGAEAASWEEPVHAYFRRVDGRWRLVGFERMPDDLAGE